MTLLVVRNEKGYCKLCSSVSYLSEGESRTSETRRLTTTTTYTSLEMGPYYHGFCGRNAPDSKTPRRNLGDRRSTFQVCSFFGHKTTFNAEQLADLYIKEIVRLYGIPLSIISDRDTKFASRFWQGFQTALGTEVHLSTAFHPQTNGQSERTIQTLEDMVRACALEYTGNWDHNLPLVEFAYNNSYHCSIDMVPYEALYGRRYRTLVCWDEVGERKLSKIELIDLTREIVNRIREKLRAAQDRQKGYADTRRRPLEFNVGDHVFLKVSPLKGSLRFVQKGKLTPRYIGPFEILQRIGPVAYRLALPPTLQGIHDMFHVSNLRRYVLDPTHVISHEPLQQKKNLSYIEESIRIRERVDRTLRNKIIPFIKVLWKHHKSADATWEPEQTMREKYPTFFDTGM